MLKPKRTLVDTETGWGICVWKLPGGGFLQNGDGEYLSAGPVKVGNLKVEQRMREAARQCGFAAGEPFWLPGFRKITQSEWEDQMERLMTGKIADAADLYRQATGENG